jgi:two-component system, OmpR family, sensor kinase
VTSPTEAPGRSGAPIAVQMISLLAAGWAITLAVTVVVTLLIPPPPRPAFQLSEIIGALQGGPLVSHGGRQLVRVHLADPPALGEPHMTTGIYRLALASALGQPASGIRLERYPSDDPVRQMLLNALQASPPRLTAPPGALVPPFYGGLDPWVVAQLSSESPVDVQMRKPAAHRSVRVDHDKQAPSRPAPGARHSALLPLEGLPPIADNFSVAVQDPSGGWTVVRPSQAGFPDAWQLRVMLWFVACFSLLAPIGYIFARRLAAPIGAFAAAAERLGRDPNAPAIELSGPAELKGAAAAFNDMQSRLRRYVEHRTAMIGAIAHDLRTPLARIRFKLEGLPPDAKEAISRDVVQMEHMIAAALAFVRDTSVVRPRQPLDLSSAVQCVVDNTALMGVDVKLSAAQPLVIHADPLSLDGLFTNLVENAVKYGKRARVKVYREDRSAVVDVIDGGPGLPESELERVFEPFYRLEPSRSPETGGMGLGLATARALARSHGGDIVLINARRGGLIARVRLPLPPPAAPAPQATSKAMAPV